MRVLQLIDSLRPGGAERMSVNFANALVKRIDASFLCCTRMEGLLKSQLSPEVGYLFLNKKTTLDLKAFLKLRQFVKKNEINLLHAHSNSWFLALWVKMSLPGVKLVWHDHWGGRVLNKNRSRLLSQASTFFDGIITVNEPLKKWAKGNLKSGKVQYIPNFLLDSGYGKSTFSLFGEGTIKIIHLSNLKSPKDHLTLLKAFDLLNQDFPQISLHLIGKDEEDGYSSDIKKFIREKNLQNKVFIYGEVQNVEELLLQANIGVLSSESEGLPVSILEYGRAGLPVVCTDVGQCSQVLGGDGKIVPSKDPDSLASGISYYLYDENVREKDGRKLKLKVLSNYSEKVILPEYQFFLKSL